MCRRLHEPSIQKEKGIECNKSCDHRVPLTRRPAISGLIKGIGWTLGVTISQEVYERCVEE
jgi:hypothetical protein